MICRAAEEELEQIPMVGPPPPAAVAEAESANEAERFEEVCYHCFCFFFSISFERFDATNIVNFT